MNTRIVDDLEPTTMSVPTMAYRKVPRADMLLEGSRAERDFGGESGFAPGPRMSNEDVTCIANLIRDHLLTVAGKVNPSVVDAVRTTPLQEFHTIEGIDQAAMLNKDTRALPKESVDTILAMPFFSYVREAFGPFHLADEVDRGYDQITFRLVRPNRPEDVGFLHRDDWFWQNLNISAPSGFSRAKVWIPIISEPKLDSLRVAHGSHRLNISHEREFKNGKLHITCDVDPKNIGLVQFYGEVGTPLFFNYETLHVGSLNRGTHSRISIETTIMYRA
jgi:hypothetical protein